MHYQTERNYGCRVSDDWEYRGNRVAIIENEIIRYMDNPSQAVTYKLGEKAFLYVRDRLLKKGYSIKDVHQIMLEIGPCPIEFLVDSIE